MSICVWNNFSLRKQWNEDGRCECVFFSSSQNRASWHIFRPFVQIFVLNTRKKKKRNELINSSSSFAIMLFYGNSSRFKIDCVCERACELKLRFISQSQNHILCDRWIWMGQNDDNSLNFLFFLFSVYLSSLVVVIQLDHAINRTG